MEIVGLEPRRSDLSRGVVIARCARPLDLRTRRDLFAALGAAGITETTDEDDEDADPPVRWIAAPWLPPAPHEVDQQRAAFETAGAQFDLEQIWCVKIDTGIDGVAWLDIAAAGEVQEVSDDPDEEPTGEPTDPVLEDVPEVLYAAPDAPAVELEGVPVESDADVPDDDDGDDDDDMTDDSDDPEETMSLTEAMLLESHWRNGAPPGETSVEFPIERYPDIIDDYDWESFGIALKLGGPSLSGEESVINAFFALWLSAYQDERADDFEAFQRADVVHDRTHRSALMWVERFAVPATASDQVHFLLWIVARIHDVLPIAWARFDTVDEAIKARATGDDVEEPFILAGNPFADRFRRQGEEAALAWAVSQSAWSKRELAGMLIEVALEHDPDEAATALVAERLLRRALSFDGRSDAPGYLAIVMVRQHRIADAIALAEAAPSRDVRLLVVGELAEHAPDSLPAALELLDAETLSETEPEELADLASTVARHAAAHLPQLLARFPDDGGLVPYLYNASFGIERPQALAILRAVLALPPPAPDAGEARTAFVMGWNNACIHAHALGELDLAVSLADGGQPYGPENPYIYHSAACAYAATDQIDRALAQVALAIEHEYEHTEKMETDPDLAPLQADPRFAQLFVEWRTRRADLN